VLALQTDLNRIVARTSPNFASMDREADPSYSASFRYVSLPCSCTLPPINLWIPSMGSDACVFQADSASWVRASAKRETNRTLTCYFTAFLCSDLFQISFLRIVPCYPSSSPVSLAVALLSPQDPIDIIEAPSRSQTVAFHRRWAQERMARSAS
jgi:hypothetical protein